MGDIFRKVKVCGLTEEGRRLGCARVEALLDTGATQTVISSSLASRIGGGLIEGLVSIERRKVPAKLTAVKLNAPRCAEDALVVAVDDRLVARAGTAPSGKEAEMILGHDYLQRRRGALRYGRRASQVVCETDRLRGRKGRR